MRLFPDENLATCNIWAEGRGEPFEGKCAIGEVVRNRMRLLYSSNGTVSNTILRRKQFSGFNDDNPWRWQMFMLDDSDMVVQECLRAWLASAASKHACGAVLYANLDIISPPDWAHPADEVAVVGHHHFFLPKNLRGK